VAGKWLPKAMMIDRLLGIAEIHGFFGSKPEQIHQLIAGAAEAIRVTPISPPAAPLWRAHRQTAGSGQEPVDHLHVSRRFKWLGLAAH
jgi:hypothetical protein